MGKDKAKRRKRRGEEVCNCEAYPFPHREGSKACLLLAEAEVLCGTCDGTGEGMYDGGQCHACKGKGVKPK